MTTLTWLSSSTEERSRLLRGSSEVQTLQGQPMTGTPREVPVPRKVTRISAPPLWPS